MNNKFNNTTYNISRSQKLETLNKEKLKQLESQEYSNRTLSRLICISELYALSLGYNNPQMYKKFDQFNTLKRKNKDELEGELILQIRCSKISIDSYKKKYKKYDYPVDFNKNRTLDELEFMKKLVCNKDKKYYKAIIKLINGDTNIPTFENSLQDLENEDDENDNGLKTPEEQLKLNIPVMKYVDSIKNNVKNNYEKDPQYKVRLNLNKPMEKNINLEKALKYQEEIERQRKIKNYERANQTNNINYVNQKEKINCQTNNGYENMEIDVSDYL